ncbi:hypothetical protein GGR56DRAFT_673511 [Xylariaceae sp. FL0804]|nr:hypothetical protein GGR56DRAFT_673511 [Xylariaceae sp. FL0804]
MHFTTLIILTAPAVLALVPKAPHVSAVSAAASSPLLSLLAARDDDCSITTGVKMTFFGSPDNDPAGSTAVAYDCGDGRDYSAGGTGTSADPLTFASDADEYAPCTVLYSPYLRKYIRMEDDCARCDTNWENQGLRHIDIWTGNSDDGGDAQIQCEDDLTPDDKQAVINNPASGLSVNSAALWDGSCHTDDVYPDSTPGDYCGN